MPTSLTTLDYASLETSSRWKNLPPPPGFAKSSSSSKSSGKTTAPSQDTYNELKEKRAWEMAYAPAKSLPMQALMLYMSGSGVQIFSMGIVFMLLLSPFKNIAGMNKAFAPFVPSPPPQNPALSLLPQKIMYILCNLLTFAVGLWKCRSMGLLPMGTGDWLAFETRGLPLETVLF
ncbi:hypothetical protein AX16_002901 [Volvariella volvacea WC 439]|nr:hypothetical protein AX16_002901 [Volvariella volvacea WC 439]